MYSQIAGKEDTEVVERWQKDADTILIFVSLGVDIHKTTPINPNYRLVYSRPLSQRCLR